MGRWGPGNFDSDGARDYLDGVMSDLQSTVERVLKAKPDDMDDSGESELMPAIELMAVLCETVHAGPPKVELVTAWKEKYAKICHNDGRPYLPAVTAPHRLKVITETFDRLLKKSLEQARREDEAYGRKGATQ
jgi:hypothetical protein